MTVTEFVDGHFEVGPLNLDRKTLNNALGYCSRIEVCRLLIQIHGYTIREASSETIDWVQRRPRLPE